MSTEGSSRRFSPVRWPVRWRIAAVSAGLTFVILVVFALVVGRLAVDKLEDSFADEAQSSANNIANRFEVVVDPATGSRRLNARDLGLNQYVLPDASSVRFLEQGGDVIDATPNAPSLGPPTEQVRNVDGYTVASQLVISSNIGPPVIVEFARDRKDLEATMGRLWFFLAGGVLGGTILAGIGGIAIGMRAMRPISSLTSAAREIATTRDPSRRIPMPDADDEVAELARTLDQMMRELDAARGETEQMIQAQRDFVADASHELRTPLTSVLANLELLEERLGSDSQANNEDREIVAGALGSSRRMRRLVSDLLLLARADAGRLGPRRSCDLAAVAADAIAEVRPVAGDHVLVLDAPAPVPVQGNPDDLHRLALNLIENAVSHTPRGCAVTASVRAADGEALLEVTDDGLGIPDGMADQIFARFVRGSGPADLTLDSGTGLGLAIVKAVALSHGGEVKAGNGVAGGARFVVRLPVDKQLLTADRTAVAS